MTCVKCGAELAADAQECPRCGVLIAKARTRPSLDDSVATAARPPVAAPAGPAGPVVPSAPAGPSGNNIPGPGKAPYGLVTEAMVESLDNTRSWVRVIVFSSALSFLLLATAGTFAYFTMDALSQRIDNRTLITFAAMLGISAFSFLLYKDYANAIERIRGDQPTSAMEHAMAAQEKIWRVHGALTLIFWMVAVFLFSLWRVD